MEIRRLLPDARTVEAERALDDLRLGESAPDDRPYVVANMVAGVDGRASVDGASAGLSSPADRALFHALRGQVDAVLAGTGTLRSERYRRLIRQPERREERRARGLQADPVAVVLSRSGDLPDIELLTDPEQPRAVFTGDDADPASALRRVRREHGVRSLLCEGGPTLLGALLAAGLVDELFLTIAPQITGEPEAIRIVEGDALPAPLRARPVWVLHARGELFLRYALQ
jgi:riboflavin biosynthesis pyrimidine reductase